MRHRLVGAVETERGDLEMIEVDQPCADQAGHQGGRMRRVHPLPAQRDAVSHHPRVGQVEAGAAEHADAAHQHHPPVRPHRQDGGPHLHGIGRGRQDVEHAVDRAGCRLQDARAIVGLVAAHRHGPDAGAEPPRQFGQRLLVAPGRDHALRAHSQRDGDGGAAEAAGGAVDQHDLSGLQLRGEEPAIGHEQRAERAPAAGVLLVDVADRNRVFRRQPHLFGPGAVVEIALQAQACLAAAGEALQGDVGRSRIVAGAHGRIAIDPVAGTKPGRVGAGGADAADRAGAGHHGQFHQVFALPAEHLVGIGQHAARRDVDNDLAGAEKRLGDGSRSRAAIRMHSKRQPSWSLLISIETHCREASWAQQDLVLS